MEDVSPTQNMVQTYEEKFIDVINDFSMSTDDDDNRFDADKLFFEMATAWFELNGERILLSAITKGINKEKPVLKRQNAEISLKSTSKKQKRNL